MKAQKRDARRAILQSVIELTRRNIPENARAYLHSRGFTDEHIDSLRVGYYSSAEEIRKALKAQGHNMELAETSGVLWQKLEGYIIFPWCDAYGNPLTLYGTWREKSPPLMRDVPAWRQDRDNAYSAWKALTPDWQQATPWEEPRIPKKIAIPNPKDKGGEAFESTKRSPLYFDRARRAGHRHVVLVEGVTDAALLQSLGDTRVIACVAAGLSKQQAETLKKHKVGRVTICLDPDSAGDSGIISCIRTLNNVCIASYVAPKLPDGSDPDEFVIKNGIGAWMAHIENAHHSFRHMADVICEKHKKACNQARGGC